MAGGTGIEITAIETKHAGWTRLLIASVRLPGGHIVRREIEGHGAAVAVLPYDPGRRTAILVRQFRAPVYFKCQQDQTLECIAGILEEADATQCLRRETIEEAGIELQSADHVATVWTMPGISTERMHLYLATYQGPPPKLEGLGLEAEHEQISVVEIGLRELAEMANSAQISDMKTLALVQTLRLRRTELFT